MKLGELFELKNGIPTTNLQIRNELFVGAVPFLRPASTQQRTLSGFVEREEVGDKNIYPAESIFVSTNGEGSHSYAYVSRFEFAANSDVSVLIPKMPMTLQEKLFYARCVTMNRWKFSYGRKPKGHRLKNIDLPTHAPDWIYTLDVRKEIVDLNSKLPQSKILKPVEKAIQTKPTLVALSTLFDVVYGTNMELVGMELDENGVNFVSRTSKNNGVSAKVKELKKIKPVKGPVLSVAGGGSVLETFLQKSPFYSGRDLFYLRPKQEMADEELLFYCACIRANQFRYSYGRQANRTLRDLLLPDRKSLPKWIYGSVPNISSECKELINGAFL